MGAHKALGRGLDALLSSTGELEVVKTAMEVTQPIKIGANEVRDIEIDSIRPNRHQPRTEFDEGALEELAESIKNHGIAQPLVVTEGPITDEYELVVGERRWRAAKLAGLDTVPCLIKKLTNRERFELALVENMQRQDLNAMEKALALEALMKEHDLTQEDVAQTLGVSRSTVANNLRFLRLHEDVQAALREGKITEGHAKILAGIQEHSEQLRLLKKIIGSQLSVRGLEQYLTKDKGYEKSTKRKGGREVNAEIKAYEEDLQRVLGRRVEIQSFGNKGWIKFAFYSPWDLDNLCRRLGLIKAEE